MGKRDTNISEANLPRPPSVEVFVSTPEKWFEKQGKARANDPVHGTRFQSKASGKRKGTAGMEQSAVAFS